MKIKSFFENLLLVFPVICGMYVFRIAFTQVDGGYLCRDGRITNFSQAQFVQFAGSAVYAFNLQVLFTKFLSVVLRLILWGLLCFLYLMFLSEDLTQNWEFY